MIPTWFARHSTRPRVYTGALSRRFPRLLLLAMILTSVIAGGAATPAHAQDCLSAVEVPGCLHGLPIDQYNAILPHMQAMPWPPVEQIRPSTRELEQYQFWRFDREDVTFYDAPNGHPIETINPGYSFAVPRTQVEGWTEVETGRWVRNENLTQIQPSRHSGATIGGGLPFPIAWIIRGVATSAVPGIPPTRQSPVLGQYTRINIFTTVVAGGWEWYLVGPGMWVEQREVGRLVPHPAPPTAGRWVAVDLYEQVLTAYEGGTPVFATLISSGDDRWPTPEGNFAVWARLNQDSMTGSMGRPDFYSIPIVPYVMYFDGGRALHGTFWHNVFGYKHSHGCVNLSITDARWIFGFVEVGTPVIVWRSR